MPRSGIYPSSAECHRGGLQPHGTRADHVEAPAADTNVIPLRAARLSPGVECRSTRGGRQRAECDCPPGPPAAAQREVLVGAGGRTHGIALKSPGSRALSIASRACAKARTTCAQPPSGRSRHSSRRRFTVTATWGWACVGPRSARGCPGSQWSPARAGEAARRSSSCRGQTDRQLGRGRAWDRVSLDRMAGWERRMPT